MNRDEMINALIEDDLNGWYDRDDKDEFFSHIMLNGWIGYKSQTDEELTIECLDRRIIEETEE